MTTLLNPSLDGLARLYLFSAPFVNNRVGYSQVFHPSSFNLHP